MVRTRNATESPSAARADAPSACPLAAVVALVVALLAAACGGSDRSSGGAQPGAPVVNPNLELRVGVTTDNYITSGPRANLANNLNIIEPLLYLTPNFEVKPLLAESWEFRPPGTWRFRLRSGVKFHDGQPLNAEAVKVGLFDRVAKQPGGGTIKSGPGAAVVVDELTVDFTPTVANLRVPEQIVHPQLGVVAPGTTLESTVVGTGPFRFVEYAPKEKVVVERNPDYWGTKAQVARITFRFLPDNNARALALRAGDLDVAYDVARPDVAGLKASGFEVVTSPVGAYEAMYLNVHGDAPFDILADPNVRRAVALGTDRKKLVSGVLDGLASEGQTFVPPGPLGASANLVKGIGYDLRQAKQLLDQSGWREGPGGIREKGGRKLKLTLVSGFPTAEAHRPIPAYLQLELKNLGIDLEIVERPDSESFYALMGEKKGDLWLEQGSQNDANPAFLPALLFYTGPATNSQGQTQGISAPGRSFDALLDAAFTEPDPSRVQAVVAEALHELIDNQVTVVPLAGIYRIYALKKSVVNFEPHASFVNVRWGSVGLTGG